MTRTRIQFLTPLMMVLLGLSASQPAHAQASAAQSQGASAAAASDTCKIDAAKICDAAMSAGTIAWAPSMGYAPTSTSLPGTARVEIPNGATVQAMCYYNPQRTKLTSADFNVNGTLDGNANSFLRSKGFCSGG